MNTSIEISPLPDMGEACFDDLRYFHAGCARNPLEFYRCLAKRNITLRCDCGMELVMFSRDTAECVIARTAIDCEPRQLASGTFYCNAPGTVSVVATTRALELV